MDQLTAIVAIAHLRLRLDILSRYPHLLNGNGTMEIKRPMELAGLKSRLARAKQSETDISQIGKDYDAALDQIDELKAAAKGHAGYLKQYGDELKATVEGMTGADNGAPPTTGTATGVASPQASVPPNILK